MAAYTTEARLQAALGTAYLAAATGFSTTPLTQLIASASDVVSGYLRNSGYTPPSDSDLSAIDQTVCLATEALVARAIANIPEVTMPMPDGWDQGMQVLALNGILSGSVTLNLTRSTAASVGGFLASESDSTVTGSRPQRASREELSGY